MEFSGDQGRRGGPCGGELHITVASRLVLHRGDPAAGGGHNAEQLRVDGGRATTPFGDADRSISRRLPGPSRGAGLRHRDDGGDLKWATAFGEYLSEAGRDVADLDEHDINVFEVHYRAHPRCSGPGRSKLGGGVALGESLRGSTRALLTYLRSIGAISSAGTRDAYTPFDSALEEYLAFLRTHRGFANITSNSIEDALPPSSPSWAVGALRLRWIPCRCWTSKRLPSSSPRGSVGARARS